MGFHARILKTEDYGKTWKSYSSPIVQAEHGGHTSVDFINQKVGFVTGGDLTKADEYTDNLAFINDGGMTWKLGSEPVTTGAFYGGSILKKEDEIFTFVCGPNGMDYSPNEGSRWTKLDSANLWAVKMHPTGVGWASGKDGHVVRINVN